MSSASVNIVLSGLEPKQKPNVKDLHKKVVDSYVPKASGVGIVDRIKSTYPQSVLKKGIL